MNLPRSAGHQGQFLQDRFAPPVGQRHPSYPWRSRRRDVYYPRLHHRTARSSCAMRSRWNVVHDAVWWLLSPEARWCLPRRSRHRNSPQASRPTWSREDSDTCGLSILDRAVTAKVFFERARRLCRIEPHRLPCLLRDDMSIYKPKRFTTDRSFFRWKMSADSDNSARNRRETDIPRTSLVDIVRMMGGCFNDVL